VQNDKICYSGIFEKTPKNYAEGMATNGHFYFWEFLGIFGNTLKILKICSQISKKYVKKHAVPKCII
jgi:hypothetical protein